MIAVMLALTALCWLSYEVCKRARSEALGFWALIVCVASGVLAAIALIGVVMSTLVGTGAAWVAVGLLVAVGVALSIIDPFRRKPLPPGE
jgi:hypothetical protein